MTNPNPNPGTDKEMETPETPEVPETPTPNPAPPAPTPEPQPEPDYKTKFSESARENEVLRAKLAENEGRNKPLTPNPTEQELKDLYPEWDNFLPSERQILRENLTLKKTIQQTSQTVAEMKAEQAWQKDLKTSLKTFPALKGREEEFEAFVFKPTHKGVSIDALAKAFLYDATKDASPTPPPTPPPGGLERGGTGPQERLKPKLLSGEELKTLRTTNSRGYKEYIETHPEVLDLD